MGLDITAYRQIKLMANRHEGEEDYDPYGDGGFRLYHESNFPGRADDVPEGYYTASDKLDFRAGSYGDYNEWREQLAKLAGYPANRFTDTFDVDPILTQLALCAVFLAGVLGIIVALAT